MMMEAMRLSLLEHEEQQRRQAQAQSRQDNSSVTPSSAPISENTTQESTVPSNVTASTATQAQSAPAGSITSSTFLQQQQQQTQPRTSSLANDTSQSVAPPVRYSLTPQELGISSAMMAELSELVDGGLPTSSSQSTPQTSAYATPAVPLSISEEPTSVPPAPFAPASPVSSSTPPVGSPSRIGMNPNNPFRRMGGSATNSPSHSRQGSTIYPSWTGVNNPPGSRTE
jgi:hypothetical protein